MKNQFDTLVESQKEMIDFWQKASKSTMDAFTQQTKKEEKSGGQLENWFKKQRSFFEDALRIKDPKEAMERAPEQYKKWLELQQEFATHTTDIMKGTENPMEAFAKAWAPDITGGMPAYMNSSHWNKQLEDSAKWVQSALLSKMPFNMGGHLNNFTDTYQELSKYWEPFKKMIQFGLFDEKSINQFFPADAFQSFMGKFLGFQPIQDLDGTIGQMHTMFEKYMDSFRSYGQQMSPFQDNWAKYVGQNGGEGINPVFKVILDLNQLLRDTSGTMLHLSSPGKEVDMTRLLGEIQFSYIAFLIKSNALQQKVLESGKNALPETLHAYYNTYKETKEIPDYAGFFNSLVNKLEAHMLTVLESDAYSEMQSEVAQLGVQVKANLDKLVEVAVGDLPFLTHSHADEIAKEIHQLRKKIRDLDAKVKELEGEKKNLVPRESQNEVAQKLFQTIGKANISNKDDLKKIKGIGPKLEKMLNDIGVYTFAQLSKFTDAEYELLDLLLQAFQGRGKKDDWAGQARGI